MSLVEKHDPIDQVEIVTEHKHVQVRSATWVEKDGTPISPKHFHRTVYSPGQSSEIPEIQAIINAVHTQKVIDTYKAYLAEQETV